MEIRRSFRLQQNPTPSISFHSSNLFTRPPDSSFTIFPAHLESEELGSDSDSVNNEFCELVH